MPKKLRIICSALAMQGRNFLSVCTMIAITVWGRWSSFSDGLCHLHYLVVDIPGGMSVMLSHTTMSLF